MYCPTSSKVKHIQSVSQTVEKRCGAVITTVWLVGRGKGGSVVAETIGGERIAVI